MKLDEIRATAEQLRGRIFVLVLQLFLKWDRFVNLAKQVNINGMDVVFELPDHFNFPLKKPFDTVL